MKPGLPSLVLSSVSVLIPISGASAATLRVPQQYASIGAAIIAAHNGAHIVVADGVYTGPGNRNLDFAGKHISLGSANGPANCIIDCQYQDRAFFFHHGEPPGVKLEGFTIQNALGSGDGGAILCDSASPTIRNCIFRANHVQAGFHQGGGALAVLNNSFVRVFDCQFLENVEISGSVENAGGALHVQNGARASFVRCTFSRNFAQAGGAAVVALGGARANFEDCLFEENIASFGGGGAVNSILAELEFKHCRFLDNTAASGGGVAGQLYTFVSIEGCLFERNVGVEGGGGAVALVTGCSAIIDDTVCSGNSGNGDGGAAMVWDDSELVINNSTVVGNSAPSWWGYGYGGAICAYTSHITILNSVLHGNSATQGPSIGLVLPEPWGGTPGPMVVTIASSLVENGQSSIYVDDPNDPSFDVIWSATNVDATPFFVDPLGADGIPWSGDEDLHLRAGSPCIDAGDPRYVAQPGETDIDGNPRVVDGNSDGIAVIDIGACEFQPAAQTSRRSIP